MTQQQIFAAKLDHSSFAQKREPLVVLAITMLGLTKEGAQIETQTWCTGEGEFADVLANWRKKHPKLSARVTKASCVRVVTPRQDAFSPTPRKKTSRAWKNF